MRMAGKSVPKMTYFVSSGMLKLNSLNQSVSYLHKSAFVCLSVANCSRVSCSFTSNENVMMDWSFQW